jgi:adenine-specific DNA-methyltransferase
VSVISGEDQNTQKYIKERFTNVDENGKKFMKSPLQSPNPRPNLMYDYKGYKTPQNGYSISKELMEKSDKEGRLWFPDDKTQNINRKIFLDEYQGQPISSLWTDISVINPMSKERGDFESGQKPEVLIQRIIQMITKEDDIVLDYHLGSGTTAATCHKMNRRYLAVEQMDYVESLSVERLRKVIDGDHTGISQNVNWQGGGSFIYCELMQHNEAYVDLIQKAKNTKDLLAIWNDMQGKAFISYKVKPETINQNISDFEKFSLDEQRRLLIEILDKNQLYVNYSEIDDTEYRVADTDKKLNRKFYEES